MVTEGIIKVRPKHYGFPPSVLQLRGGLVIAEICIRKSRAVVFTNTSNAFQLTHTHTQGPVWPTPLHRAGAEGEWAWPSEAALQSHWRTLLGVCGLHRGRNSRKTDGAAAWLAHDATGPGLRDGKQSLCGHEQLLGIIDWFSDREGGFLSRTKCD